MRTEFITNFINRLRNSRKLLVITVLGAILIVGSLITTGRYFLSQTKGIISQKSDDHVVNQATESGEVAGVSTENVLPTTTPTTKNQKIVKKPPNTPTPTPQSSNTGSQPSNSNSNQSTNNSSTTPISTPQPTTEPIATATPQPTPTPTPDSSPFDASMTMEGNTVTITANKPLQKCQWVAASTSGMSIVVSNNGDGTDLISGNICTVVNNNPQYSFGVRVTSIYGEAKILGSSPLNYW